MNVPFNKPYLTGKEAHYIYEAVYTYGHISGNGAFTKRVQNFFEEKYGFRKTLMTTSCTDALEMSAMLLNIQAGDEVIMPSFTFVSTANAFVRQGAHIVFADSRTDHPGMDEQKIEALITPKTKAIVELARKYNIYVVEDAAQAIDSYYKGRPLGGIGHLAAFSFHETKNIQSGEGGLLVINEEKFIHRAEIIWEKGTNRAAFFRGEVNKYGWVDVGSSFLPSDILAAFLYAQLENIEDIQHKRLQIWNQYYAGLLPLEEKGICKLPKIPEYASNNAHMFYLICNSLDKRTRLIKHLKENGIYAVFHYLSLHKSDYYLSKHYGRQLPLSDLFEETLLRLPMYYELTPIDTDSIIECIIQFYKKL